MSQRPGQGQWPYDAGGLPDYDWSAIATVPEDFRVKNDVDVKICVEDFPGYEAAWLKPCKTYHTYHFKRGMRVQGYPVNYGAAGGIQTSFRIGSQFVNVMNTNLERWPAGQSGAVSVPSFTVSRPADAPRGLHSFQDYLPDNATGRYVLIAIIIAFAAYIIFKK
jgi:hypothetical protein